jgi:hypothetical protein
MFDLLFGLLVDQATFHEMTAAMHDAVYDCVDFRGIRCNGSEYLFRAILAGGIVVGANTFRMLIVDVKKIQFT